jgi:flagellar biosynthesis/type III secretory pathway M-ring protein FliF/YscJ
VGAGVPIDVLNEEGTMDSSNVIWLIVAIVVALIVIAALIALSKRMAARKDDQHRERAGELREQAAATHQGIRKHQAEADAVDARAREMRAEADRKQAEAKRLEAEAQDKRSTLHEHVERRDEVLRQADDLDPDVETDAGDRDVRDTDSDTSSRSGEHRA